MGSLKFLHLSDIHFKRETVDSHYDLDKVLRAKLEQALRDHVAAHGQLSGLLISGDIAFGGAVGDYEVADLWISTICEIIGINWLNAFMVPGNHDIDRTVTKGGSFMDMCHRDLRGCPPSEIDAKVRGFIEIDKETILRPLHNYNHFSSRYSCSTSAASGFTWTDNETYRFDGGIRLSLHGINTALISDQNDHAETGRLACTSYQSAIVPDDDEIYMVLAHHPPDWIRDGDVLKRSLNDVASIQLFGHKHEPGQFIIDNKSLVVAAGAVHPERQESQWIPSFNILELDIVEHNLTPQLQIKTFKYRWSDEDRAFTPKYYNGSPYRDNHLEIKARPNPLRSEKPNQTMSMTEERHERSLSTVNPERYLAYKYIMLALVYKVRIATDLGLLNENDLPLEESFFNEIVKRGKAQGKLKELWIRVAAHDANMKDIENPF